MFPSGLDIGDFGNGFGGATGGDFGPGSSNVLTDNTGGNITNISPTKSGGPKGGYLNAFTAGLDQLIDSPITFLSDLVHTEAQGDHAPDNVVEKAAAKAAGVLPNPNDLKNLINLVVGVVGVLGLAYIVRELKR